MVEFEDSLIVGTIPLKRGLKVNLFLKLTHCLSFLPQIDNLAIPNSEDGEVSCCVCMVYPPFFLGSVEQKPNLFNVKCRTASDHLRSTFSKSTFAWTCSSCYL
jgi:hypothetical protein